MIDIHIKLENNQLHTHGIESIRWYYRTYPFWACDNLFVYFSEFFINLVIRPIFFLDDISFVREEWFSELLWS